MTNAFAISAANMIHYWILQETDATLNALEGLVKKVDIHFACCIPIILAVCGR